MVVPFDKANTPAPASDDKAASADADPTAGGMTQAESELLASGKGQRVRVWARRVWTLELSLVSPALPALNPGFTDALYLSADLTHTALLSITLHPHSFRSHALP